MKTTNWTTWQLIDASFPGGGFAHSGGLEAAWRRGVVQTGGDLERFVQDSLVQSGRGLVPFLLEAHGARQAIDAVDADCHAWLSNHVANKASRTLGRSFLAAAEAAFGREELAELRETIVSGSSPGHYAVVFGHTAGLLGLARNRTAEVFLYIQLRDMISAAVRLNVVGPLFGQGLLYRLGPFVEQFTEDCADRPPERAAQTAPVIELISQTHDRLYTRLFQS